MITQTVEQPTERIARVVVTPPSAEEILGELVGSARQNRRHGPECAAYRHTTRSLARILRAVLGQHPDAPHGCRPDLCPRPVIARETARRWRPL